MTALLWAAIGLTTGAAVLHASLGMRRPLDATYLSFACIMALLAVFLYFQWSFYNATTAQEAVEAARSQLVVTGGFMACLLVFIPAYTKVRLPRALATAFWVGLLLLLVANLFAPHALWYSERPELVRSTFRGEPYNTVVAKPMGVLQFLYIVYFMSLLVVSFVSAIKVYRRGERRRGLTLAVAVAVIILHSIVDIVRDNVQGSWPYIAEFGVVTWGVIMSVQLAREFRAQAQALGDAIIHVEGQAKRLRSILASLHALEQNMNAPLQRLESGVAALDASTPNEAAQLARLRRTVSRLREFSRSMPDIRTRGTSSSRALAT